MAKSFDLSIIFKVTDKITRPVQKIGKSVDGLSKPMKKFGTTAKVAFSKTDVALRKLERRFERTAKRIERSGFTKIGKRMQDTGQALAARLTLPFAILGGVVAKRSIDFETAWTGVRKTVKASESEFNALKKELMDMALTLPISTTEIFNIAESAGQLGIATKDIATFTKVMADLGATTNLTTEEAATSLAKFANIMQTSSKDFDNLGSTIVDLGNNMATTERDIVAMGLRLAGAGNTIKLSESNVLALAAALSSVGIEAEAGGTAFSQVMKKIDKEIGTNSKKMQDFAAVSGKSVEQFEKDWKENAGSAIIDFTEGLAQIQKQGANVNLILDELGFEGIRISDALLRASGAGDKFRNSIELGNKAWKENVALLNEANLRYSTSASRLTIAKNRVDQLAAAFGDVFVPVILKAADFLKPVVQWLQGLSKTTKIVITTIGILAAVIPPLIIALGALAASFGVLGIAVAPFIATIAAIVAAITGLITLGTLLIRAWTPVKSFFKDLFKDFAQLKNALPNFLKQKLGIEVGPKRDLNDTSGLSETSKRLLGVNNQSKTDINIKVQSDQGSTATVERVKRKTGDANVNVASVGYVGAF